MGRPNLSQLFNAKSKLLKLSGASDIARQQALTHFPRPFQRGRQNHRLVRSYSDRVVPHSAVKDDFNKDLALRGVKLELGCSCEVQYKSEACYEALGACLKIVRTFCVFDKRACGDNARPGRKCTQTGIYCLL